MHVNLPTNTFRVFRHLSLDNSCHRCGAPHESILHTLRDCGMANKIWELLNFHQVQDFFSSDLKSWLKNNILHSRGTIFVVICWIIWKERNVEIFNDLKWEDRYVLSQISFLNDLIHKAFGTISREHCSREVKLNAPPEGFCKINVDGSSLGNPDRSSCSGLIRNIHGQWLSGLSAFYGVTTKLNAELLAIYHVLDTAWKVGHCAVICEYNSQMALDLISKRCSVFSSLCASY